jgi:hypothetical protein
VRNDHRRGTTGGSNRVSPSDPETSMDHDFFLAGRLWLFAPQA